MKRNNFGGNRCFTQLMMCAMHRKVILEAICRNEFILPVTSDIHFHRMNISCQEFLDECKNNSTSINTANGSLAMNSPWVSLYVINSIPLPKKDRLTTIIPKYWQIKLMRGKEAGKTNSLMIQKSWNFCFFFLLYHCSSFSADHHFSSPDKEIRVFDSTPLEGYITISHPTPPSRCRSTCDNDHVSVKRRLKWKI